MTEEGWRKSKTPQDQANLQDSAKNLQDSAKRIAGLEAGLLDTLIRPTGKAPVETRDLSVHSDAMTEKKRIYAANEEQWRKVSETSRFRDKTLRVDEVEKGIVLPPIRQGVRYLGGCCTNTFAFVGGFLRNSDNPAAYQTWSSVHAPYEVPDEKIRRVDEEVIFGGVLHGFFGHFILESMARLWYVCRHPEDRRRIAFIYIEGFQDWFRDFLDLLDLERERILFVEEPTRFARVTVPEEAVHSWGFYTDAYLIPYRRIVRNIVRDCGRGEEGKLYLTRSAYSRKGGTVHCNEEYFERFHADKGFKVVAPERLPIKEQIRLMAGANEVVTTLASLSHFALFCRPGTRFTMLTRTNTQTNNAQVLVNEASGVDWTIIDASANLLYAERSGGACSAGADPLLAGVCAGQVRRRGGCKFAENLMLGLSA